MLAPVQVHGSRMERQWTFHGEDGDLRRDEGHLQLFRTGKEIENLTLQDLHGGLIEDSNLTLLLKQSLPEKTVSGFRIAQHGY